MKDLDFDELDRAVNSIMSGSKTTKPTDASPDAAADSVVQNEPEVKPAPVVTSQVGPSEGMPVPLRIPANEPDTKEEVAMAETSPAPERKPPVAARRGRFMDMVRPSATPPSEPVVPTRVSRQGTTVERAGPLVTDIIPTTSTPPEAKKASSAVAPTPAPVETPAKKSEWPDPLDMLQDDSPLESSDKAPLVSPFVSGAKVEKRPLGGGLNQAAVGDSKLEVAAPIENRDVHLQLTPNPTDASAPLPEELSTDVMAIESDANTFAMPADEVKTEVAKQVVAQEDVKPAQEPTPLTQDAPDELPVEKETPAPAAPAPAKVPMATEPEPITPKGPISIPQQYREEPSTGDKENGAIYDTDTYHHQPLAHPKKKKSGWLWVVWIVLILALGAAGGAALYWLGVF